MASVVVRLPFPEMGSAAPGRSRMIRHDTGEVTMDRGPAALFGAIVAVGLGPAMWLGVRLGAVDFAPVRPPVVSEHTAGPEKLVGGAGAGDSPLDGDETVKATPRAT